VNGFLPCLLILIGAIQAEMPLSVEDAVRIALGSSSRIRAARFAAQAAQTQTDREKPIARPTVTAQAQGTYQGPRVTFPRGTRGEAIVLPERYGRVELILEQVLYRPGLGAARERYGAQTRANEWELRRAENDVTLDARRAYFQLLTAQVMAEVARDGVTMAQRHLKQVRDMLEAGLSSERDVKASEADLAEAEQGAIKAENGVALARANLNRVVGRAPDTPLTTAPPPPTPDVPDSPEDGIALALGRRPEVRLLEENLRAARAGVSLAGMQNRPSLSARATAVRQTPSAFVDENYYAASLVLTWNLFDAGKTKADVQEAKARVGQLEALLEEAKLGIRVEVEKAWRDMREAKARIEAAERQVTAAEAALEVSELRYQVRAAIQLEVSGARFNLLKARVNRAQALYDLYLASADYAHATGADVREK